MEGAALSTSEFAKFAKDVVLFAHVTSHVEGDKFQDLLSEKGGHGFPYLVFLDEKGDVVGKPTARTVESFTEALGVAKRFVELRSKKDKSAGEQIEVLAAEIGFGSLGYDEAKQRAAEIEGLTDAQKARIEELLVPLEVRKLLPSGRSPSPEARQAAGKAFAGMLEAGRVPKTEREYGSFFVLILDYAESAKDAGLFETALGKLRDRFGSNPRLKTFFDRQDARLKALKEAGR